LGGATLSLSTNAFPEGELAGCLEWAARLGLAGVEVGPLHAQPLAGSDAALA
jgi:sugar phosphate isomerase/epimerase